MGVYARTMYRCFFGNFNAIFFTESSNFPFGPRYCFKVLNLDDCKRLDTLQKYEIQVGNKKPFINIKSPKKSKYFHTVQGFYKHHFDTLFSGWFLVSVVNSINNTQQSNYRLIQKVLRTYITFDTRTLLTHTYKYNESSPRKYFLENCQGHETCEFFNLRFGKHTLVIMRFIARSKNSRVVLMVRGESFSLCFCSPSGETPARA